MHSTNVLRLSAGMNRSLIAKFGRKKIKSESNLLATENISKAQEDGEKRAQSAGKSRPSIANIGDTVKNTKEVMTSPKANVLGIRRRKRGKESPGQTPLRVENTKFKTRRTGSLGGETSRRKRRTRRHSPKRRSFSLTENVERDVNFEKAIEQAKTKPPKGLRYSRQLQPLQATRGLAQ